MTRAKRPYEGTDAYEAGVKDTEIRLRGTSEWEWNEELWEADWGYGAWVCKACKCRNDNLPHTKYDTPYRVSSVKFCTNCGRRMVPNGSVEGE